MVRTKYKGCSPCGFRQEFSHFLFLIGRGPLGDAKYQGSRPCVFAQDFKGFTQFKTFDPQNMAILGGGGGVKLEQTW